MSPIASLAMRGNACFPRVSGDEPGFSLGTAWIQMFSPRERG